MTEIKYNYKVIYNIKYKYRGNEWGKIKALLELTAFHFLLQNRQFTVLCRTC